MSHGRGEAGERPSPRVSALVRVILCISAGVIVAGAVAFVAPWQVSSLLAWDTGAAVFCATVWFAIRGAHAATTERTCSKPVAIRNVGARP